MVSPVVNKPGIKKVFTPQVRDVLIDSLLYSMLFYVLANKQMYGLTAKLLPNLVKDRVLLHAVVYALVFVLIQKLTARI